MSLVTRTAHGQKPMQKAPPLQRDSQARADESSIRSMTGGSKTPQIPGHARIRHEKIGDHREAGHHSGSANSSAVPRTSPGHPTRNGGANGID
jgi:hypothetical protein